VPIVESIQLEKPQDGAHDSVNLASQASEFVMGATESLVENQSIPTVKPAFLGAAAQSVANNGPILDDETGALATITEMARAVYVTATADAASRFSMASSIVSVQMDGTPQPVHEALLVDLSASYAAAVSSAFSQLNNVIEAASRNFQATQTAAPNAILRSTEWAKAETIAANKLDEGRIWAEMQYSRVKISLDLATSTPAAKADQIIAEAKRNYYAGLGVAQERYIDFIMAASSAFNALSVGPTPTSTPTNPAESASSMASVSSASAASIASSLSASMEEGASVTASIANSPASAVAETEGEAYDAAGALVSTWDSTISHISAQIYGQPTPLFWNGDILPTALTSATDKAAEKVANVMNAGGESVDVVEDAVAKDEL